MPGYQPPSFEDDDMPGDNGSARSPDAIAGRQLKNQSPERCTTRYALNSRERTSLRPTSSSSSDAPFIQHAISLPQIRPIISISEATRIVIAHGSHVNCNTDYLYAHVLLFGESMAVYDMSFLAKKKKAFSSALKSLFTSENSLHTGAAIIKYVAHECLQNMEDEYVTWLRGLAQLVDKYVMDFDNAVRRHRLRLNTTTNDFVEASGPQILRILQQDPNAMGFTNEMTKQLFITATLLIENTTGTIGQSKNNLNGALLRYHEASEQYTPSANQILRSYFNGPDT